MEKGAVNDGGVVVVVADDERRDRLVRRYKFGITE